MKLKDITPGLEVEASIPDTYGRGSTLRRATVKGRTHTEVQVTVGCGCEEHFIHARRIKRPWSDVEAEEAKREAARARERAAWDAKRAEERQRFEEHILPAFKGLPSSRDDDLAEYIADMMLDGGSTTVQFREADLRAIADRVMELGNALAQNALTADDLPEAGWGGHLREPDPIPADAPAHGPFELPAEERVVIDIPFERLGLAVKDGDA